MELLYPRCAGLDVHNKNVVACVRISKKRETARHTQTFSTTTKGLLSLADWLNEHGVTHAVMESTGVYWRPVWHVLDGHVDLSLANATEVRNLPGRKSDVSDAQWLADLLAHGLLKRSFVPDGHVEELRELTRTRTQTVREVTRHTQRIDKILQDANIKMRTVLTKTLGKTGRLILRAMINGEDDPKKLADLAIGVARRKLPQLEEALEGFVRDHHRFMLRQHLDTVEHLEKMICSLEQRIDEVLLPFEKAVENLQTIPGIGKTAAHVVLAETGGDMSRFPSAGHLVSWAGLCPRMDSSAGKNRSTRIRKGNAWLKSVLNQCAWSAIRTPGYLRARYNRIRRRAGKMQAIIAVARTMLVAIYHMLKDGQSYRDLGESFLEQRNRDQIARALARRIDRLGFDVELKPRAA